ncbi:FGGY family carbohydrate kinase [Propionicicella superfundia]|uniref:FGGY family carbohydrate kinase n=1 Tax=Propionicicella superfundia TaxID=348582 RepID=UPI0004000B57|nr:FGGY family carbohydrate kinase [Propionicicella superfundia]
MAKVVIGVDGGTTAVKAVAFDLSGNIVASHKEGVPVEYGKGGEAEQDMTLIWEGVAACLKGVADALPAGTQVVSIGLTGQGDGCWLVGTDGRPVRKAAIWLDGRAPERVAQWLEDGKADAVLEVTGTTTFPGLAPVLLAEFAETEPESLANAGWLAYCKDWLRYNLTGVIATDYTEASRNFLDVRTVGGYSAELAEKLGLSDAFRLVPEIRPAHGDGGTLTAAAAAKTGLPEGTPVGIGQIDVAVTGAGLGAVEDGQGWLILGTTGFVGALLGSVAERRTDVSMVLATGQGTQVLEFLPPMTGTPNLDWIRDTLGLSDKEWDEIEKQARTVPAGSGGVIYLPYASPGGERAPFLDTNASASWLGMSITTSPAEILRSVYEGVAFSLVECVRTLELTGDLIVSGGGFRSDLVCQILADATGQTVVRQDAPEAGARGAAVYALVTAGEAADLTSAAGMLASDLTSFAPDPENLAIYQKTFDVYVASREAVRPVWPAMRALRSASQGE